MQLTNLKNLLALAKAAKGHSLTVDRAFQEGLIAEIKVVLGEAPGVLPRDHGTWRTAMTLARNLCIDESNRYNDDDQTEQAVAAIACADRVGPWREVDDDALLEMLEEAGAVGGASKQGATS